MTPTEKTRKLPLWPIIVFILVILFLFLASGISRFLYTKDFIKRSDYDHMLLLQKDLEELNLLNSEKQIVFVGSKETSTNASCLDLTKSDWGLASIYDLEEQEDLTFIEKNEKLVYELAKMGLELNPITVKLYEEWKDEISSALPLAKVFPWYDSMLETEHFIIVQLSKEYTLP